VGRMTIRVKGITAPRRRPPASHGAGEGEKAGSSGKRRPRNDKWQLVLLAALKDGGYITVARL